MFTKFLYTIVITAILFIAISFLLPRYVHVERSIEIERPAATVFNLLNSYATFSLWSPWAERDPDTVYEFSGPESGVGARMNWSGDPRLVGSGWQEIIESTHPSLVRTSLFFDQQGLAESYFQLLPVEAGVQLTWGFDTDLTEGHGFLGGVMARYFGLLFDKWVGSDYEQGLANLKNYAESIPLVKPDRVEIEVIDVEAIDILYISSGSGNDPMDVAASLAAAFQEISAFMLENGLEMAGEPMAINRTGGEQGYRFDAAIPYRVKSTHEAGGANLSDLDQMQEEESLNAVEATLGASERVQRGQSPSGLSVRVIHRGSYSSMSSSYQKLAAYMDAHDLAEGEVSWEQYVSDPGETDEEDLVTYIFFLIKD